MMFGRLSILNAFCLMIFQLTSSLSGLNRSHIEKGLYQVWHELSSLGVCPSLARPTLSTIKEYQFGLRFSIAWSPSFWNGIPYPCLLMLIFQQILLLSLVRPSMVTQKLICTIPWAASWLMLSFVSFSLLWIYGWSSGDALQVFGEETSFFYLLS